MLAPLFAEMNASRNYDRRIAKMAKETYPETALLKTGEGCGRPDGYGSVHSVP